MSIPIRYILGFLAAVFVVGGGVFLLMRQQAETPQPIACTMEAKLCPDGSAVGRTGPNCEFAACPSVPTTPTPPSPPTPTILPYGDVALRAGEEATFSDVSITFLRVANDSRCATGVTCIWAGTLKAEFRVMSHAVATTETIELGKSVTNSGVSILLKSADPYPKSGATIAPNEYRLTLHVLKEKVVSIPAPAPIPEPTQTQGSCYVGGCSGEICSDRTDIASTCIYREEYACYKKSTCERQSDGACGWRKTPELAACLANPSGI